MMGLLNLFAASSATAAAGYSINMADLANSGKIMLLGMVGIFLVIIVIYLIVLALGKFFPEKKDD
ncbi:OadG-related small transporter subunit [Acetanaerobacterium elongatum]|uniref:Oxaloacetate decarboxylase, gamma chain n=1 Tax=Acetanaerobacterium elongatum TaxID=258515 RepID=A0A1G9Z564_9FIRM|nr:OadG-related small transporter subunit [Acetanaerobacterium elongatum]SDN16509.1 hypothetical protein SAMN05192585_11298 [Acetanaerobacterium elongatum]